MFSSVAVLETGKVPIQINLVNGTQDELELYINGALEDIGNYNNETSSHQQLPATLLSRPTTTSFQIILGIEVTVEIQAQGVRISLVSFVHLHYELRIIIERKPTIHLAVTCPLQN